MSWSLPLAVLGNIAAADAFVSTRLMENLSPYDLPSFEGVPELDPIRTMAANAQPRHSFLGSSCPAQRSAQEMLKVAFRPSQFAMVHA
jgi:hypothetical protein